MTPSFDIQVPCEVTPTIKPPLHRSLSFFSSVARTLMMNCLSKFHVIRAVLLAVITLLSIRSPEFTILHS